MERSLPTRRGAFLPAMRTSPRGMSSAGGPAMKRTAALLATFFLLSVACGDSDADGAGGDGGAGGSGPSTSATSTQTSSSSTSTSSSNSSSNGMTTATTDTVTTGTGGAGGSGGGMACAHDVCMEGPALDPACSDPCVATVCAEDEVCCDPAESWDDICVGEAQRLCAAPCGLINVGDLVITEIMNNPNEVLDADGEWFEIHNITALPIDLNGFTIHHDLGGSPHMVTTSFVVAAGDYAVIGINADMATNGGVTVDYVIPDLSLNNNADYLALVSPLSDVIDDLGYDQASGLDPDGASRSLDPNFIDYAANDTDVNFCEATSFISGGAGDRGTPGAPNDPCP